MNRLSLGVTVAAIIALTFFKMAFERANLMHELVAEDLQKAKEELAASEFALEQSRLAAEVAKENAERLALKAEEFDEIEKWINANDDQTPMPALLRDVFDRVFTTGNDN